MIIIALVAIALNSSGEFTHASISLVVSRMYAFPAAPEGSRNKFLLQCTTSLYVAFIIRFVSSFV